MPALMAILSLISSANSIRNGNQIGGAMGLINSISTLGGLFNQTPIYNNTLGDFGVRRNQF